MGLPGPLGGWTARIGRQRSISAILLTILVGSLFVAGCVPITPTAPPEAGTATATAAVALSSAEEKASAEGPGTVPSAAPSAVRPTVTATSASTRVAETTPVATTQPTVRPSMPGVITQSTPAPTNTFTTPAPNSLSPGSLTSEPSPDEMLALLRTMETLLKQMQAIASIETRVPTVTLTPTPTATPPVPAQLGMPMQTPGMMQMMGEMQDLYRLMQATMLTMQVLMQKQPTDDEMAAMQAQMNVVAGRMARLQQQLRDAEIFPGTPAVVTPSVNPAPTSGPSLSQVPRPAFGDAAGQPALAEPACRSHA